VSRLVLKVANIIRFSINLNMLFCNQGGTGQWILRGRERPW